MQWKLASRIAWRSLVSRPGRTLTSMLGIAVGVSTVLSVLIVDHNTILTEMMRRTSLSARPDLEIRPVEAGVGSERIPRALLQDPDLAHVAPAFSSRIRVLDSGAEPDEPMEAFDLELVALDRLAGERFDAFRLVEGQTFTADDSRQLLLSEELAAELGVSLGDQLTLQRAVPSLHECQNGELVLVRDEALEGTPREFEVVGLLAQRNLGRRRALLIPYGSGLELFRGAHIQPLFWAHLTSSAIYQDVRQRLKAAYVVDKPKGALVGERVDQLAFRKSVRMTALLSLLLGLFVIYNAFSLSLVQRVRELGLLRAIGLTASEISAAVMLEGALLSLLGVLFGFLLSLLIVMGMRTLGITTLGFGKPLVISDIPWKWTALVLTLGMGAAMLGMIAPLFRVRSLSVVEAVRGGQIAYRPDPTRFIRTLVLALLPGLLLMVFVLATPPLGGRQEDVFRLVTRIAIWLSLTFGLVLLMPRLVQWAVLGVLRLLLMGRPLERPVALASTRGSHHRVFGSTLGVGLVLAALLSIHGITKSLKDEAARFSDRTLSGRIFVQTRRLPKVALESARQAPGVTDFYSLSAEVHSPFPIRGIPAEHAERWLSEFRESPELAAEFERGSSIVLSEALAANFGYSIGDQVRLSTFESAYAVRVAVVSDRFGYFPDDRNFALMALPIFRSLFCVDDEQGTQYVFHVDPHQDPDDVQAALLALLPRDSLLRVRTAQQIRSFYLADMNRDFWIFQVILVLTSVLAFVGLWNSLTVALLERRREIGLLRTLGFTSGQMSGMLAAESAALGLVGGALALAAGLPISHDLVEAIRVISRLDVRYVATGFDAACVPLVAVGLALLATVPAAVKVRGQVVASATRME